MGRKKSQQRLSQSVGQMVSRAALTQLQQPIFEMVQQAVKQLGTRIALKQAESTSLMFTRIVAIEKLLIEKNIVTQDELQNKVADIEDERDGAVKANDLQKGDTARLNVRTKDIKAENFESGITKLKVMKVGTGDTMGTEVETAILGMKVGETKTVTFADDKLNAEITLCRVARPMVMKDESVAKKEGTDANSNQVQG